MKEFADKLPPFVVLRDFAVFIMDRATPGKIQKPGKRETRRVA